MFDPKFNTIEEYFDHKALLFAEKYGIIEYRVKDGKMAWIESYPTEGDFIHTLDLTTMKQEQGRKLEKASWEK